MTVEINLAENPKKALSMHPKKFVMWLFLVSVTMLFASLTSAYVVRKVGGDWHYFDMPSLFYVTTVIIVASSLFMERAYFLARKGRNNNVLIMLTMVGVLGTAFMVGQWYAWEQMVNQDVYFVGNSSGSFLYVLTGLHMLHLLTALMLLIVVIVFFYRSKVKSHNFFRLEMCRTYWHFLGGLWLYLFIFLELNGVS